MKRKLIKVKYKQEGMRLVDVVAAETGVSKKEAQSWLDAKLTLVNGNRIWMKKHEVHEDDVIEILSTEKPATAPKKIQILWQDNDYLVINKPAFLLSNAHDDSVEARLRKQENNNQICAVHRLDKETSGCLIFAKTAAAKEAAIPIFKERDIMKIYRAITVGQFPRTWNEIHTDIDGHISITLVKPLDTSKLASYLELRIETGRTHQIRRHLADKRYPVMGDKKYGGTGNQLSLEQPRQMLHAYRLIFQHPATRETIRITAPIPADFKRCLAELRLK
jgi:23S rRNA pseudouridine1911/1915/1917 synthase